MTVPDAATTLDDIRATVRRHWGYEQFLPLQEEAIECVLSGCDSLVVLPTGGGKSLSFQAPAVCRDRLAVVVSPLIALMKDQVDALEAVGIAAACVNSSQSAAERGRVAEQIRAGRLNLLYLAPERLVMDRTLEFLATAGVTYFAIDEAHCISSWGHDFRPEYRELAILKNRFPEASVHAYTATATEQVRADIVAQLHLSDPQVVVGSFDRPNLNYRVRRQDRLIDQVEQIVANHAGESGIVYCTSRKETEATAAALSDRGHRALPYHAGLEDHERRNNQEAFLREDVDVIVATVAFGMGIDKSNVRFVVHAGMPKSLEAYQQESGRAGRDGLEAECVLIYSGADFSKWKRILEADGDPSPVAVAALSGMFAYATGATCRHSALVEHFGQQLAGDCQACDVCQGDVDQVDDPLVLAQKIVSCVARLEERDERYGAEHVAQILTGSKEERVVARGHDRISTYGLLANEGKRNVRDWIEQLAGQGCVERVGEYSVLAVTPLGWQVLRGELTPRLLRPAKRSAASRDTPSRGATADDWEGVDRGLFDSLRHLRRDLAAEQQVPAYIVFGDGALRDMARRRPTDHAEFLQVKGVGEKKAADYADVFLERIREFELQSD
jgi:ATP-dependent DNA helicase RecQ